MRLKSVIFFVLVVAILALAKPLAPVAAGITPVAKEVFTGTVIGVGGQLGGVSRPFTLTIDSYTPSSEASKAIAMLAEGGQDALLKSFQGRKLGTFSLGGQLGRDVNFVQETRTSDGKRRIVVLFERWLNLYEVRSGSRSEDYPFTYVELVVDSTGRGDGTLIPAAKIYFDKKNWNQLDIENFGIYPARLAGVQERNS